MDLPTNEPTAIRAGDSASWTRELPAFSAADGWALKYRLLYASGSAQTFNATGAGTLHTVSLTAANTAGWVAGSATLVAYVEKAATSEKVTLESTPVTILPDLTTAATHDGRSTNQIALANLRAAMADMTASGALTVQSVSLEGRSTTFRSTDDLAKAIAHYEREVARENALLAAVNGVASGRVQVRF